MAIGLAFSCQFSIFNFNGLLFMWGGVRLKSQHSPYIVVAEAGASSKSQVRWATHELFVGP
jgi:hypothetical protein